MYLNSILRENFKTDSKLIETLIPQHLSNHKTYIENGKYKCEFEIGAYEPEDIKLKTYDSKLIVEAHKFRTSNFDYKTENEILRREIDIPDFVDVKTLKSFVESYKNGSNLLIIEADLKNHKQNETQIDRLDCFKNGYIRYKFDLRDYEPNNISLSVKNKKILVIYAFKRILDPKTHSPILQEFNHEIDLPENTELHNIKNSFDENDGVLRIEVPIRKDRLKSKNKSNSEKYLELMFDLSEYKFDGVEVYKNENDGKRIMEVRAMNEIKNYQRTRKYILPDWVKSNNMNLIQEKQIVDGVLKNFLIIQLAIVD